jgi:sugar lactone lactonase YvrE
MTAVKKKVGSLVGVVVVLVVAVAAHAAPKKVWWTQKTSTEIAEADHHPGLVVDKQGNVYYWEESHFGFPRVHRIGRSGVDTVIAGSSSGAPYPSDGAKATGVWLAATPGGVGVDSKGDVFIAYAGSPNGTVWKVTPDGVLHTFAGGPAGTAKRFVNGAPATSEPLGPVDLAVDAHDNLFVAEPRGVIKITPAGIASLAAGDLTTVANPGHPTTSLLSEHPGGLAADRAGNMYVVDRGSAIGAGRQLRGRVLKIAPSGAVTTFIPNEVVFPGITTDSKGRVYAQVSVKNAWFLRQYSPDGKLIATLAGGARTYHDRAPALGNSFAATTLAFDKDGNVLWTGAVGNYIYKLYLAPPPKKR